MILMRQEVGDGVPQVIKVDREGPLRGHIPIDDDTNLLRTNPHPVERPVYKKDGDDEERKRQDVR
jgi:hypothetical protein